MQREKALLRDGPGSLAAVAEEVMRLGRELAAAQARVRALEAAESGRPLRAEEAAEAARLEAQGAQVRLRLRALREDFAALRGPVRPVPYRGSHASLTPPDAARRDA